MTIYTHFNISIFNLGTKRKKKKKTNYIDQYENEREDDVKNIHGKIKSNHKRLVSNVSRNLHEIRRSTSMNLN